MQKEIKRYYKQRHHGGRSTAARVADIIALYLIFAVAAYLWYGYHVTNQVVIYLLTGVTTFLFFAATHIWRAMSFDRFVKKEQTRLKDAVLRERLLLLSPGRFRALCEQAAGLQNKDMEQTYLCCVQQASPLHEDAILQAYHQAANANDAGLLIASLSPLTTKASALLTRLPIHTECILQEDLMALARERSEYAVTDEDVDVHIMSEYQARLDRRARMQRQPFSPGRTKQYLICGILLIAASFVTGYAIYYRLLAGLCLLLSGTTYFINRPPRQKPVEQ